MKAIPWTTQQIVNLASRPRQINYGMGVASVAEVARHIGRVTAEVVADELGITVVAASERIQRAQKAGLIVRAKANKSEGRKGVWVLA